MWAICMSTATLTSTFFPSMAPADLMVFPFPYKYREPIEHKSPFLIGVALKAHRDGYTFSPATSAYWTDRSARLTPKRIRGPEACNSSHVPPPMVPVESIVIPLAANACQHLWLEFDTVMPDPSQRFFVQLTLTVDQHEIQLPLVEFHEAKGTETVAIP
jgi:hypothetical protein